MGCARRHGRAGPDHLRLPEGTRARADRRRVGRRRRVLDEPAHRRRRRVRRRGHARRRDASRRSSPGAPTRARAHRSAIACPIPTRSRTRATASRPSKALQYMGLEPGTPLREVKVDTVFVGSCTNGRIEDLRAAAQVIEGRTVADGVRMLVVPGSMRVREQAEQEGLDAIFTAAGAEWRQAGCSMCLGMNPDQLAPGERSASHVQPQLRGTPGQGRTHPPGQPARRRGHRDHRPPVQPRRPVRSRQVDGARITSWTVHRARGTASRCAAATSTPTRSSRRCT